MQSKLLNEATNAAMQFSVKWPTGVMQQRIVHHSAKCLILGPGIGTGERLTARILYAVRYGTVGSGAVQYVQSMYTECVQSRYRVRTWYVQSMYNRCNMYNMYRVCTVCTEHAQYSVCTVCTKCVQYVQYVHHVCVYVCR